MFHPWALCRSPYACFYKSLLVIGMVKLRQLGNNAHYAIAVVVSLEMVVVFCTKTGVSVNDVRSTQFLTPTRFYYEHVRLPLLSGVLTCSRSQQIVRDVKLQRVFCIDYFKGHFVVFRERPNLK